MRQRTDGGNFYVYKDILVSSPLSSQGIHTMDATPKTALLIALVVVVLLLLFFGGGMATGTMFSGGMMGGGAT